ncbi:hypothetical protein [Methanobrevibacter filiformis]|uniref:Uncharacterized protein n=1 Tax=Methanobrevibacter filiformis TaxID=55758 RepID=A0A165ZE18_9EURY|nr:hypothetical protein [Methanobrevibacter filiformis]KZX10599.1 hypothetical protein MBFIL_17170 [Methanobrevibacter filiformis]
MSEHLNTTHDDYMKKMKKTFLKPDRTQVLFKTNNLKDKMMS